MTGSEQPAGVRADPGPVAPPEFDTDRVWTVPNLLSMLRLAGVPLMLWLILGPRADGWAVAVLALGGVTDWLDGHLARAWHQTSRVGRLLDPIADRLYILAVLLGLASRQIIPWWLAAALITRDVMIACLIPVLRTRGRSTLPVHFLGKAATFSLLYAFPLVLLGSGHTGWLGAAWVVGWAFALWGTGLYWFSGLLYLAETIALVRAVPPGGDHRSGRPQEVADPTPGPGDGAVEHTAPQ